MTVGKGCENFRRAVVFLGWIIFAGAAFGTDPKELSHVERFAPAKVRYEHTEADASARLRKDAKSLPALSDRGMARLHLGKTEAAIADFRREVALAPKSAPSHTDLAYGLWVTGHLREALAEARSAVELDANWPSAQYDFGRLILITGGDPKEAAAHLERAVRLNPTQTEIYFDLLTAYRMAGDGAHAQVELRLLRAALPPTSAVLLYAEGLIAADRGEKDTAIEDFKKAVAANPQLTSARQDLGVALAQAGQWKEAAGVLAPLAREQPNSYPALYYYALALQNSGERAAAESEIRRALTLAPLSADAYTLLGIILAAGGDNQGASGALAQAAKVDPKSFDARLYLGRARFALGDYAGARQAFQEAVALDPSSRDARFFLATTLQELGDADGALAQYKKLIQLSPKNPEGYVGLGTYYADHGEYDQAISALNTALQIDSENFEASLSLGRVLLREEQWDRAIPLLKKAAEQRPDSADAHYQLGLALRRDRQVEEAKKEFAIVERLNQMSRSEVGGMGKSSKPRLPNP